MKTVWIASCVALLVLAGPVGCKKTKKDETGKKGMAAMAGSMGAEPDMGTEPVTPPKRVKKTKPVQPVAATAEAPEAVLSEVTGTVEVRTTGETEFKAAAKDQKLHAGDSIRAGKDGEATLALWDNSSVEMTPASAVTLNESAAVKNPSPSVTVLSGAVRFDVNQRTEEQGPFAIYTPAAAVAVQGTVLAVGVGLSGSVRVAVEEGQVAVTPVVKVDAKAILLPKGKVMIILAGKGASPATAYNPDKAGWDEWLEAEDSKAINMAAGVAKEHADQVEGLGTDSAALETAVDTDETQATALVAQAAAAQKKNDVKIYRVVQPKLQSRLDRLAVERHQLRLTRSRLHAHAYLLALMRARMDAGVYKVSAAKRAKIIRQLARTDVVMSRRFDVERRRYARGDKRIRRLHKAYFVHHYDGRRVGVKVKRHVPPFYAKVKLRRKMRAKRYVVAGYSRPMYRQPVYRGKRRAYVYKKNQSLQAKRWWANKKWRDRQNARQARNRANQLRWRKAVVKHRMKRWAKRPNVERFHRGWKGAHRPGVVRPGHLRPGVVRPGHLRPGMMVGPGMMHRGMMVGPGMMHRGMMVGPGMPRGMRFGMRLTPMERRKLRRKLRDMHGM